MNNEYFIWLGFFVCLCDVSSKYWRFCTKWKTINHSHSKVNKAEAVTKYQDIICSIPITSLLTQCYYCDKPRNAGWVPRSGGNALFPITGAIGFIHFFYMYIKLTRTQITILFLSAWKMHKLPVIFWNGIPCSMTKSIYKQEGGYIWGTFGVFNGDFNCVTLWTYNNIPFGEDMICNVANNWHLF